MAFLRRTYRRLFAALSCFNSHNGQLWAAGIAYYLAFSLFPLMLVLVAVLGWAFRFTAMGQDAEQRVLATIADQASPQLGEQVKSVFDAVENRAAASGAFGLAALVITSIAIFAQMDSAFDSLWDAPARNAGHWFSHIVKIVLTRLKALVMLMGIGGFIIVVMIASLVLKGVQTNLSSVVELSPWIDRLVQPGIHVLLNCVGFSLLYRYLPKVRVRWSAALAGGLVAAVLWEIGRQVLAAYVVGDKLPTAYGVIGSFMAVMLWTYYAMIVLLLGAAYTRVLNEEHQGPTPIRV